MSGTFPSSPAPSRMQISSVFRNLTSYTQSGIKFSDQVPGHKWRISLSFDPMSQDNFMELYSFALEQQGTFGTFQYVPPDLATPRGAFGGTPVVDGAGQTGTTLNVRGASISITNWGRKGDPFLIAGNNKVYRLTQNANTDGTGDVTLTFQPELIIAYADGAALTTSNVPFTMNFANDSLLTDITSPTIYGFSVDMLEDISV